MPFIPHTKTDIEAMLASIGASSIADLFAEIPAELKNFELQLPDAVTEWQLQAEINSAFGADHYANFIGAGAYHHHIPAAVWQIATRGEFMTAYTPYQAEVAQGSLQLIYEYQSMICRLTGMDVSNASLYDGATSLAEAALMALRLQRKAPRRILAPASLHPNYLEVLQTLLAPQDISIDLIPVAADSGTIDAAALAQAAQDKFAALIISQPNFFGQLEAVADLVNFAHQHDALAIAVVNPMALAVLQAPGSWGNKGADIVCGEGQPLGIPLAAGGPYFGFMATRTQFVRQLPGRVVGASVDEQGRTGYCLTLQAREQHIRRAKATSNICTNQGLMVTAATIYMAIMGPKGLQRAARASAGNLRKLLAQLTATNLIKKVHTGAFFHEAVIETVVPAAEFVAKLAEHNILAGYQLPELGANKLLVCTTELNSEAQIDNYAAMVKKLWH